MQSTDPSNAELQLLVDALIAERDAAVGALERHQADADEQARLLVEEQDRFVTRLLASHENEAGRLRLELEEARTTAGRLEQKLERVRVMTNRLEEDLASAMVSADRLRQQREEARAELRRAQQVYGTAQMHIERLEGDLSLARSMLEDAMAGDAMAPLPPSDPNVTLPEVRESGIRRPQRNRRSTPPASVREPPLAAGSSSRPPR